MLTTSTKKRLTNQGKETGYIIKNLLLFSIIIMKILPKKAQMTDFQAETKSCRFKILDS
jgi:hypothetical protein